MSDHILTASLLLALSLLGATAAAAPRALMRYRHLPRAMGLTDATRAAMTRAAGVGFLLLSMWLAWRLFLSAA